MIIINISEGERGDIYHIEIGTITISGTVSEDRNEIVSLTPSVKAQIIQAFSSPVLLDPSTLPTVYLTIGDKVEEIEIDGTRQIKINQGGYYILIWKEL